MARSNSDEINFCYHCMSQLAVGTAICPNCGHDNSQNENAEDILHEGTILFGKYFVGRMLGRGGFGVTYLGLDIALGIKVAIKEFYPVGVGIRSSHSNRVSIGAPADAITFERGCEEFQAEAKTLAQFNSPNIVHVRDYFRENGTAYIIMDFVEGNTLTQELKQQKDGRIPWRRVLSLFDPLIRELTELHNANMIHRDIKPDNIKIAKDKNGNEMLVLLDFGAARYYISEKVTKTYTSMVTPGYAPIEQYTLKSHQGPFTDVYGICASMYALIMGERPATAPDRVAGSADLVPFSKAGLDVPPNVEKAIYHGLEVLGINRTQTMDELHKELYGSAFSQDTDKVIPIGLMDTQNMIHTGFESVPGKAGQQTARKIKWWIPVLLAVLIAGGFGAVKIIQNQQNKTREQFAQTGTVLTALPPEISPIVTDATRQSAALSATGIMTENDQQDAISQTQSAMDAENTETAIQSKIAAQVMQTATSMESTRAAEVLQTEVQAALDAQNTETAIQDQIATQVVQTAESIESTREAETRRTQTQAVMDAKNTEAAVQKQLATQAAQTATSMESTREAEMRQTQTQAALNAKNTEAAVQEQLATQAAQTATSMESTREAEMRQTQTQAALNAKNTEAAIQDQHATQAAQTATSMELTREAEMHQTQTQAALDAKNTEAAIQDQLAAQTATSMELTREAKIRETQTQAALNAKNTEAAIQEQLAAQAAQTATSMESTREAEMCQTQTQAAMDAKNTQAAIQEQLAVQAAQTATSMELIRESEMRQTQTRAAMDAKNTETAMQNQIATQAAQTATSMESTRQAEMLQKQTQAAMDAKNTEAAIQEQLAEQAVLTAASMDLTREAEMFQTQTQAAADVKNTETAIRNQIAARAAQTATSMELTAMFELPTPTMTPTVEPSPTMTPQNLLNPAAGSMVISKNGKSQLLLTENNIWASIYAVSVGQYEQCVNAGVCVMPDAFYEKAYPGMTAEEAKDLPMVYVTEEQASSYCRWAGMRLPTADEWIKAAKLPENSILRIGNVNTKELPRKNFLKSADQNALTIPVTYLRSSPSVYNMVQMYGNTWEWVSSDNDDPSISYARGGAWNSYLDELGPDVAFEAFSGYAADNVGFRCFANQNAMTTDFFETGNKDVADLFTRRGKDNSKMVSIPYSVFSMGSSKGAANENPVHEITLSAYWIDIYEVTNAQYALCVADGVCTEPHEKKSFRQSDYYGNPLFDNYPVIFVDWEQAKTYCEWAGGRLPTEAEWEYAAKGPNGYVYPWGNTFEKENLNFAGNGNYDVLAADANPKDVSSFGVYDLGGNVSEWVLDVYQEDWYTKTNRAIDPTGPDLGKYMVIRGGSCQISDNYARSTNRFFASSSSSAVDRGFRCVMPGG